ncbi:hypothetical protein PCANC_23755 [Puccinia coronata f. sp. avenae]|uniref:Uncharacterized protein n=1 Tax=Puccinia coronata f. sp. avenae TaxID=200324 RepID=A0A2N5UAW4_9BASI|nr:hypothetical protein PCANC_23755 [Puccinia coronata f. sp. avenae]
MATPTLFLLLLLLPKIGSSTPTKSSLMLQSNLQRIFNRLLLTTDGYGLWNTPIEALALAQGIHFNHKTR